MNEEVKKILEEIVYYRADAGIPVETEDEFNEKKAQVICQLFPKTEDNPDGYEPKPSGVVWLHQDGLKATKPKPNADDERIYPCDECGKLRSKNEGGTTFTVCKECWDKAHSEPKPEGYTLSCDNCGGAFFSPEAFPSPQLCPECSKPDRNVGYVGIVPEHCTRCGKEYTPIIQEDKCPHNKAVLEPKPEDRLLELTYLGGNESLRTVIIELLKAQRDLTASILEAKYAADMEHLSHLVDDVINLEEKLKGKDAECQERVSEAYTTGYNTGSVEATADLQRQCQARVERILKELETCWKLGGYDGDRLQALLKREGV